MSSEKGSWKWYLKREARKGRGYGGIEDQTDGQDKMRRVFDPKSNAQALQIIGIIFRVNFW